MKQLTTFFFAALSTALMFSSCNKTATYSCKCKISGDETTVAVYEQTDKKQAKSECKDFEKQNAIYTDCKISEL